MSGDGLNMDYEYRGLRRYRKRDGRIYRVIQEERSMLWEVTVSVIVTITVYVNLCLILNGCEDRAVGISRTNSVRFLFVGV
jgi:hypothetical protein